MTDRHIELNRRALLAAGSMAALGAAAPGALAAPASATVRFPKGFRWGASTAGHQIEGNNVNSDLWFMETVKPQTFDDPSGDTCDSYHRWREDIAIMKAIGLNAYRFSIEWARIEPIRGQFSLAEIDHYKRFIAALREAGIEPVVTFYHVAAPRWFAEAGGWLNPESPDLFANYCDRAMRLLGAEIGVACTINEPQVGLTYRVMPQSGAYFDKEDEKQTAAHAAAAKATGRDRFVTMNHPDIKGMTPQLMAAHEKAFAAIKAVRGDLPTGVTLNLVDFEGANEGSRHMDLRKAAYGGWLEVVKRAGDFVGVQTYRQIRIPGSGAKLPDFEAMPYVDPAHMEEMIKQPTALRNTVEYVYEQTGKPIFVTENGLETEDDRRREWYIPQVLKHLHEAIAKGVPVMGYMHWSLIDNFEWLRGYKPRFGLASVDRQTFARTLKPSAAVYRKIIRNNAVS
ncbi:beta-glucosidase [Sphingomonas sp. LH128]|jgi:beta-glucosidase|uniref:glycoside hydrolase family 1 protein n=1 Tax=Sphingomonas sp. LH128 TaxID=473781 RepID=UPI00027CA33B|nr:family 1 glycosylhydrolase [Sphingomonas sp. LH128]EJU13441.1 beta-glucosidase [Sphingomonas sp. LH128]